jgi:hypothetical protein
MKIIKDAKKYLVLKKISLKSNLIKYNYLYRMGEALLKKETLALPDIVDLLGPRPYPMKETLIEYL